MAPTELFFFLVSLRHKLCWAWKMLAFSELIFPYTSQVLFLMVDVQIGIFKDLDC